MKLELEIITDRLPTPSDGEWVLKFYPDTKIWQGWPAEAVNPGDIWAKMPPPPKPPIDTSLAASIERIERDMAAETADDAYAISQGGTSLYTDDITRIIEAARKWDENQKLIASLCDSDANVIADICGATNDPDGVGEGWRRCDYDDAEESFLGGGVWYHGRVKNALGYRRRIEADQ